MPVANSIFILNRPTAIEQYNIVKRHCDCVSYSFKTNPSVGMILEDSTDSSFCIHSGESLKLIKDKTRVWFFAQAWDDKELDSLIEQKVQSFVVDNIDDLDMLINYINRKNIKVNLMLRMRLKENTVHTGKYFVFGMYSREINKQIPHLRKNKNIQKLGIHFHRKTQNISEWSLADELSDALDTKTLESIDILDIGGGLPIKYRNYNDINIDGIFKKIKELRKYLSDHSIKLMIEPGRFISAPSVRLVAQIKKIYDNNIILNCSIYNSAMDTIVANIKLLIEGELDKGHAYTVKGCTPCSTDIFRYRVFLKDPKPGDKIVFLNAGAYTYSTDFCSLDKLEVKIED